MGKSIVADKSYLFAVKVIPLYKCLCEEKKKYMLSKQLLKSGTAIGALIKEAEHAQSKRDFLNKMNIALKEANETEYWLILLRDSEYLIPEKYNVIKQECVEINKLLIRIVKTTKEISSDKCLRTTKPCSIHCQLITYSSGTVPQLHTTHS